MHASIEPCNAQHVLPKRAQTSQIRLCVICIGAARPDFVKTRLHSLRPSVLRPDPCALWNRAVAAQEYGVPGGKFPREYWLGPVRPTTVRAAVPLGEILP